MEAERSHSPQCSLQVDMYCTGLAVEMCLCENSKCFQIGLDTCFHFLPFLPISLCSPVIPIMFVKLFSNYAENFFLVHTQNVLFSMCAHALNGDPHVIITFSRRERFEASLLLSLV